MPEDYEIAARIPDVEIFMRLRAIAGLSPKSVSGAAKGLPNSLYGVLVFHDGEPVGMGRIIGDGGTAFQITDIAVDPAHQGKGLGKAIMANLTAWLESEAPDNAYVSLIADGDARHLYARFGFTPVAPASIGMARVIKRPEP